MCLLKLNRQILLVPAIYGFVLHLGTNLNGFACIWEGTGPPLVLVDDDDVDFAGLQVQVKSLESFPRDKKSGNGFTSSIMVTLQYLRPSFPLYRAIVSVSTSPLSAVSFLGFQAAPGTHR